jgi:hypothetical protein
MILRDVPHCLKPSVFKNPHFFLGHHRKRFYLVPADVSARIQLNFSDAHDLLLETSPETWTLE